MDKKQWSGSHAVRMVTSVGGRGSCGCMVGTNGGQGMGEKGDVNSVFNSNRGVTPQA